MMTIDRAQSYELLVTGFEKVGQVRVRRVQRHWILADNRAQAAEVLMGLLADRGWERIHITRVKEENVPIREQLAKK